MTKKDFELIARVLREAPLGMLDKTRLINNFCFELTVKNPRFDEQKFRDACAK